MKRNDLNFLVQIVKEKSCNDPADKLWDRINFGRTSREAKFIFEAMFEKYKGTDVDPMEVTILAVEQISEALAGTGKMWTAQAITRWLPQFIEKFENGKEFTFK